MRISLLLQREPFQDIFESTLGAFLLSWTKQPHEVHWRQGPPLGSPPGQGQLWLANAYLNAIFIPQADPAIFAPVKQEFSRSTRWWRRGPQRLYVDAATSPVWATWLAQASVIITPGLPRAEQLLIIPGNHKIRLLDRSSQTVYAMRKSGFPEDRWRRELDARRLSQALGLPVPRLISVAEDGGWFTEEYFVGTPLNRLQDPAQALRATHRACEALHILQHHTLEELNPIDYLDRLLTAAQSYIETNTLLNPPQKQRYLQTLRSFVARIETLLPAAPQNMPTAITHGDFQPANILVAQDQIWLIDWEYAARRQIAYDIFTFLLGSRFPTGLAQRLSNFIDKAVPDRDYLKNFPWWETCCAGRNSRLFHGSLFLLEDMVLRLEENNNPWFFRMDNEIEILRDEMDRWLQ